MIYLLYPLFAISSLIMTLITYIFAPIIVLFQKDGKLILSVFGTPDNPATGDPAFWPQTHPTYSDYQLAVTWMWRNPAQGFDQRLKADVTMQTPIKVWWRKGDNYLYTCDNAFHLSYRLGLSTGGFGWRLNNIVEGYPHQTMGQIVCTPIRFHR